MNSILIFCVLLAGAGCQGKNRVRRIVGGGPADQPPVLGDEEVEPPAAAPSTDDQPLIFVNKDRINAKVSGLKDPDGTFKYLGIRYALPPTGRFRFQRPRRVKLEADVRATRYGPPCIQPAPDNTGYIGSEDCLFLNVHTPQEGPPSGKSKGLPVVVWIHGGNFRRGSAAQYDPKPLVKKGVIVVTVQYRLGSLGFLSIGRKELPGNVGLFDISAAMRWVRQYIRFFGGNPKQVISSGQGSGASCACMMGLNKYAKSIVGGIFSMSGSSISPFSVDKFEKRTASEVSAVNGCDLRDGLNFVRCMQQLSLAELLRGDNSIEDVRMTTNEFPKNLASLQGPGPTEEGMEDNRFLPFFVPVAPLTSIKTDNFSGIPLLIGVTKEETNTAVYGNFFHEITTKILSPKFLQNGIFNSLLETNTGLYKNKSVDPQLQTLFLNANYLQFFTQVLQGALSDFDKIIKHTTDALFNLPAYVTSHLWSLKGKVFLYSFEHTPKKPMAEHFLPGFSLTHRGHNPPPPTGPGHGDDLIYLFNLQSLYGIPINSSMTEADLNVREHFTYLVAEFAKTGKPKVLTNEVWAQFNAKLANYMIISKEPKMAKNFKKCEMGLWTGETTLLNSPECSFLGAAGKVVMDTIGSTGTTLLQGVSSFEKGITGNLKPIADGVAQPFNAVLNPLGLGFGGRTTTRKPQANTKTATTTTKPSTGVLGNFGGFLG